MILVCWGPAVFLADVEDFGDRMAIRQQLENLEPIILHNFVRGWQ